MNDKIGLRSYQDDPNDFISVKPYSDYTNEMIDEECLNIVKDMYEQTR
jgi:ATP-dependent Zn protease